MKKQIMWILHRFQINYKKRAAESGIPQILTIPYSHYNELAKWSWDIMGKKYEEHAFGPGGHVLPVTSLRIQHNVFSKTSFVETVRQVPPNQLSSDNKLQTSETQNIKADKRAKAARSTAVPVMVLPDGTILADSWSIVEASGLHPIKDLEFKKILDEQLGPLARQHAYMHILRDRPINCSLWDQLASDRLSYGWFWWIVWWLIARYFITPLLIKMFQSRNDVTNKECTQKLKQVVAILSTQIQNRKTKYLYSDDVIGTEDLALASLAAILVYPDEYCRGNYYTSFMKLQKHDEELRKSIAEFRATAMGNYVLEIYKNHRLTTL